MNHRMQRLFLLVTPLIASFALVLNADESNAQDSESKQAEFHEFRIPRESLHQCLEPEEAERRYQATKQMASADVYAFGGPGQYGQMIPILKMAIVRKIGGGSADEPMAFGVDVTAEQKQRILEAIESKQLFIIYYHHGW